MSFTCPVTFDVIPVGEVVAITSVGQAYSPGALDTWFGSGHDTDPMTRMPLDTPPSYSTHLFISDEDLAARLRLIRKEAQFPSWIEGTAHLTSEHKELLRHVLRRGPIAKEEFCLFQKLKKYIPFACSMSLLSDLRDIQVLYRRDIQSLAFEYRCSSVSSRGGVVVVTLDGHRIRTSVAQLVLFCWARDVCLCDLIVDVKSQLKEEMAAYQRTIRTRRAQRHTLVIPAWL